MRPVRQWTTLVDVRRRGSRRNRLSLVGGLGKEQKLPESRSQSFTNLEEGGVRSPSLDTPREPVVSGKGLVDRLLATQLGAHFLLSRGLTVVVDTYPSRYTIRRGTPVIGRNNFDGIAAPTHLDGDIVFLYTRVGERVGVGITSSCRGCPPFLDLLCRCVFTFPVKSSKSYVDPVGWS